MYPSNITNAELMQFRRLLGNKGKDKIEWDVWKYSIRKNKFQALTETFRFLGLTDEKEVLTSLGKSFVFGRKDAALVVGLVQSDYFCLFQEILSRPRAEEELFDKLSLECGALAPEKQRRSMLKAFKDISLSAGLISLTTGKVALTPEGSTKVVTHCKVPLWASGMPPFAESQRIEHFKALYYETGHPFRDIVKDAFSELGLQTEILPKKVSGIPDIKIMMGQFSAVVETKGENKQIGENDVNQLTKAQSKPVFQGNKLIFVGNAFRLKPPEQRGDTFHKDAVSLAEAKGIALISSLSLISALQKKWKKEFDMESAIKNLSQNGLCSQLY